MFKSIRWLWPIVGIIAGVSVGCGSPPTDETDPLPTVFGNKPVDPTKFGPDSGTGMGTGTRGSMMMAPEDADRHDHGGRLGAGGGSLDGKGGGEQTAKSKKDADPKKGDDPTAAPADSSKQEKKDGPDKEQP